MTHGIKLGDIFVSSWGYEQTNVDFFEVVKVTPKGVGIVEIGKQSIGDTGGPSVKVVPVPGSAGKGAPVKSKQVRDTGGTKRIRINSYSTARLWDGQPEYQTGASYGH